MEYLNETTRRFQLERFIKVSHTVTSVFWREEEGVWELQFRMTLPVRKLQAGVTFSLTALDFSSKQKGVGSFMCGHES